MDDTLANRTVQFQSGSSILTPAGRIVLDQMAAAIRKLDDPFIAIVGNTDNTGNRSLGDMHTGNAGQFIQGVVSMLEGVVNGSRPYNGDRKSVV